MLGVEPYKEIGLNIAQVEGADRAQYPAIEASVELGLARSLITIPGTGCPGKFDCGEVYHGAACAVDPGHWSRPHPVGCFRLDCPICWSRSVQKTARRATDRFLGFLSAVRALPHTLDMDQERADALRELKRRSGRPLHLVYSPPPGTYSPDVPVERIWRDSRAMMRSSGLLAGYCVLHPVRLLPSVQESLREENHRLEDSGRPTVPFWEHVHAALATGGELHDYAYWSPHMHVCGIGYLERSDEFHELTGWIYKNRKPAGIPLGVSWNAAENRFDDDIYRLLYYLLTHAAYIPGKRSLRTFGYLNPQHVRRVGDEYCKLYQRAVCPVCGGDIVRYWWSDGAPDEPQTDIEGELRPVACRICGYNYEMRL